MLAYVLLILISVMVSAGAIWMWRLLSNNDGLRLNVLANRAAASRTRLKTQQGFMSLSSSSRQSAKHTTRLSAKGDIKAPWGW